MALRGCATATMTRCMVKLLACSDHPNARMFDLGNGEWFCEGCKRRIKHRPGEGDGALDLVAVTVLVGVKLRTCHGLAPPYGPCPPDSISITRTSDHDASGLTPCTRAGSPQYSSILWSDHFPTPSPDVSHCHPVGFLSGELQMICSRVLNALSWRGCSEPHKAPLIRRSLYQGTAKSRGNS